MTDEAGEDADGILQEEETCERAGDGTIVACAGCRKIYGDSGVWIQQSSPTSFSEDMLVSHGMCPDCISKYYPLYCQRKSEN